MDCRTSSWATLSLIAALINPVRRHERLFYSNTVGFINKILQHNLNINDYDEDDNDNDYN